MTNISYFLHRLVIVDLRYIDLLLIHAVNIFYLHREPYITAVIELLYDRRNINRFCACSAIPSCTP